MKSNIKIMWKTIKEIFNEDPIGAIADLCIIVLAVGLAALYVAIKTY